MNVGEGEDGFSRRVREYWGRVVVWVDFFRMGRVFRSRESGEGYLRLRMVGLKFL